MNKYRTRFVIRKVRKGSVRVFGRLMRPNSINPVFEGTRLVFGVYPDPGYVSLWGTEEMYKAYGEREFEIAYGKALPILTDNGVFLWQWWRVHE